MRKLALITCAAISAATLSTASTLDFTTSTYASTFGPNVATDAVDGVNFTITATARGVNGFRQGSGGGLKFGVPGNGMYSISIVADQDLSFNSMFGKGHSLTQYAGQLPFDLLVDGVLAVDDMMFGTTALETVAFGSGPIMVSAGQSLLLAVDFGSLVGSSIYASALVKSIDFDVVSAPTIPLPAGLPLLLAGLGMLGLTRRYKG